MPITTLSQQLEACAVRSKLKRPGAVTSSFDHLHNPRGARQQVPPAPGWLEVMLAGQLTRDPALRTRSEQEREDKRASSLRRSRA